MGPSFRGTRLTDHQDFSLRMRIVRRVCITFSSVSSSYFCATEQRFSSRAASINLWRGGAIVDFAACGLKCVERSPSTSSGQTLRRFDGLTAGTSTRLSAGKLPPMPRLRWAGNGRLRGYGVKRGEHREATINAQRIATKSMPFCYTFKISRPRRCAINPRPTTLRRPLLVPHASSLTLTRFA